MSEKIWHVTVRLEAEYWDIPARTKEEAFEIASDAAMSGGVWIYLAEPIIKEIENE